jgi:hypothetical protein
MTPKEKMRKLNDELGAVGASFILVWLLVSIVALLLVLVLALP